MKCSDCERYIVDALYGELAGGDAGEFGRHIEQCPDCRRAYAEMRATLAAMDRRERPDPGQAYWDGFYSRLTARMGAGSGDQRRGWLRRLLPGIPDAGLKWAYRAIVAALLIFAGAVAGRWWLPGPDTGDGVEPAVTAGRERATAEVCARRYIEDSKVLLLGLVHFDAGLEGGSPADWAPEKRRSQELLARASSLKDELDGPDQRRLRRLVAELELILIQIANLETTGDLESVELIRDTVDEQGVLLRINVEQLRGGAGEEPAPGACDA